MAAPVEEKNRCWRLRYSDEVAFHLDALPCVPEEQAVIAAIVGRGVPGQLAEVAVAITDKRHPQYQQVTRALFSSNPRGFAGWFEQHIRPSALDRMRFLVSQRAYADVEDVPPYEWKTPLQRSIQLLKRHRDVMFRNNPDLAPISMIITNLSAHAYQGERDLWTALANIVSGMPQFVNNVRPRVPNPADPAEDYADRWANNPALEENFWAWHTQARADLDALSRGLETRGIDGVLRRIFMVELAQDTAKQFERPVPSPRVSVAAAAVPIARAPKPWSS